MGCQLVCPVDSQREIVDLQICEWREEAGKGEGRRVSTRFQVSNATSTNVVSISVESNTGNEAGCRRDKMWRSATMNPIAKGCRCSPLTWNQPNLALSISARAARRRALRSLKKWWRSKVSGRRERWRLRGSDEHSSTIVGSRGLVGGEVSFLVVLDRHFWERTKGGGGG